MSVAHYLNIILESDSEVEKVKEMLLEALKKSGNLDSDEPDQEGRYFIYDNEDREKYSAAFEIKTAKSGEIFEEPFVGFYVGFSDIGYSETLLESIIDVIIEIEPACAYGTASGDIKNNLELCYFEYYRDPYDFCIFPYLKGYQISNKWFPQFKSHTFLMDPELNKLKKEYKKKLSRNEIISILRKHSQKVWVGKNGAGVRTSWLGPRYWVRKRLHELGFRIKPDEPERMAIALDTDPEGTKWIKKEDFEKENELNEKSEEKQGKKSFFSNILGKFRKEK